MSVATHKTDKTMKKTYINPTLDVVEIKYQHQLLAGSNPAGLSDVIDPTIVGDGTDVLTREADFELEEEDGYDYDLDDEDF